MVGANPRTSGAKGPTGEGGHRLEVMWRVFELVGRGGAAGAYELSASGRALYERTKALPEEERAAVVKRHFGTRT